MEQKTIDFIKIVLMFGLMLTMICLAVAIFIYGAPIKADPCSFCDCTFEILKGGIK